MTDDASEQTGVSDEFHVVGETPVIQPDPGAVDVSVPVAPEDPVPLEESDVRAQAEPD